MTDKPEERRHSTGFAPIADIRAAMTFLTRLPVGGRHRTLDACAWAFPIAGISVGVTGAAAFWLAGWAGLPSWIAAFLTLTATALVTGALHEDGLADAADGLGAGGSVDRKLEIMRDSRIGGYGALALILATGIKSAAIASFVPGPSGAAAILAVHVLSRAVLPGVMALLHPASTSGVAASVGRPGTVAAVIALILGAAAVGCLIGPLMSLWAGLVAVAAAIGTALAVGLFLARSLGGYNGDTIGLLEQLCEIAIMLALLIAAASFNISVQTGAAFG